MSHHDPSHEPAAGNSITRRGAFAVGGAGAITLGVAACGSATKSGAGAGTRSGGAAPSAATSGASAPAQSSAAGAVKGIAKLDHIAVGSAISAIDAGGQPIIVGRPAKDSVVGFSAICTHMGCTVKPEGAKLICPCHGSQYNALTGAVLHGPAPKSLPKVAVRLDGQEIVLG